MMKEKVLLCLALSTMGRAKSVSPICNRMPPKNHNQVLAILFSPAEVIYCLTNSTGPVRHCGQAFSGQIFAYTRSSRILVKIGSQHLHNPNMEHRKMRLSP